MNTKTHQVFNQYQEISDYNLFLTDRVLTEYFSNNHVDWASDQLSRFGEIIGTKQMFISAQKTNEYTPVLHVFDSRGNRIDRVDFHPHWHLFMELCKQSQLISAPFSSEQPFRWSYSAAYFMLQTQVEAGAMCPATMTMAAIPVLMKEPQLWNQLKDKLLSDQYDQSDIPISEKKSIWIGMGMTEKQGGSDVRSNTTRARPIHKSGRGEAYLLTGHKWFLSAPMCDAHIIIAKTTDTDDICSFFVPRWKPDKTKNNVELQRLKNKVGNKSNASSEVELRDAYGILIGPMGRGIPTIMEMANCTRLCCILGSAGLMRQACVQAIAYARQRQTFGKPLYQHDLMRSVLTDFALENEGSQVLALKLAESFEHDDSQNTSARAWKRLITPVAKYWICKRAETLTAEAMEVFGGNGYVEDSHLARLFREAPVNSIWEGSANVMCLDVLRVIQKDRSLVDHLLEEFTRMADQYPSIQNDIIEFKNLIANWATIESKARLLTERLACIAQACLLIERSPDYISHAFVELRIKRKPSANFGSFDADTIETEKILQRSFPIFP